jgi:Protein of unknown function (DUF2568)
VTRVRLTLLVLRVAIEVGIVAALAYWGFEHGNGTTESVMLAIAAPAVGFGIWGGIDFHQAGRLAEPMRLVEELVISAVAVVAVWRAGAPAFAIALAAGSIVYHAAVYAAGERLLKPRTSTPGRASGTFPPGETIGR